VVEMGSMVHVLGREAENFQKFAAERHTDWLII
jgi:hypothetical protein